MENKKLTVSVAIATYNGGKFFEKQMESIVSQTRIPDQIVISDDGSKDATLEIAHRFAAYYKEISFLILTDTPVHGCVGNFEWAFRHTSGDYVFYCDQDDVWDHQKIEKVMEVAERYPGTPLIAHELNSIDGNDAIIPNRGWAVNADHHSCNTDHVIVLKQADYLPAAVSVAQFPGMATCVSQELLRNSFPFYGLPDRWLQVCALSQGDALYLELILASHRLHGGNLTMSGSGLFIRMGRALKKCRTYRVDMEPYQTALAIERRLADMGFDGSDAYLEAQSVRQLWSVYPDIANSSRIMGALKLVSLFFTNARFRISDPKALPFQLIAILRGRVDREEK